MGNYLVVPISSPIANQIVGVLWHGISKGNGVCLPVPIAFFITHENNGDFNSLCPRNNHKQPKNEIGRPEDLIDLYGAVI